MKIKAWKPIGIIGKLDKKFIIDNKIHNRAYQIKSAFSENLRRASYMITSRAGLVLPLRFQNPPALASPFMTN
jgi:hypothetical protein